MSIVIMAVVIAVALVVIAVAAAGVALNNAGQTQRAQDEGIQLGARARYWLTVKNKSCKSCCITCKYYNECSEDIRGGSSEKLQD